MTDQPVSRGPYCKLCWDYGCSHPHTGRDAPAAQVSDLDAIQARANAATPGEWAIEWDTDDVEDTPFPVSLGPIAYLEHHGERAEADAQFIAHTRADVPALIAYARSLETELNGRDEEARERWIQKQEDQLGIRFADFRNGKWEMDLAMGREMAAAYVAMAKTMLGDAPNYTETRIEFDVKVAESPEVYTLVVQRHAPGTLTPHEARQRAEARVAELEQQLAAVGTWVTSTQHGAAAAEVGVIVGHQPAAKCGAPHPVAVDTRCDRQPGHNSWHCANGNGWPNPILPGAASGPAAPR